jgi:hypothetical protein
MNFKLGDTLKYTGTNLVRGYILPSIEWKMIRGYGPYAYRVISYRDPLTGRPRKKRLYIGKLRDYDSKLR